PRRNAVGRRCPHHATLMPAITWACCSSPPASDPMRWRSSKPFCDTTPITPRHDALAAALYESGRFTEAVAEFTQTMRLNPNWAGVRDNLKLARRAAGITKKLQPISFPHRLHRARIVRPMKFQFVGEGAG